MKRFLKFLLLLSTVCLFSCESVDNSDNDKEQIPENLPDFCDVQTIEGWSNVRFCKNGTVIFTKNFDGTQQVSKALMFVPSEECGITSIYGEYDEIGMPKYLSFDDAVVFVEDYKDGVANLTLIQGDEYMWAVDDLELSFDGSRVTRAWNENNWVRNTCAVGGVITSAIGVGAGVVVTGSGVGTAGGVLMIGMSSAALANNLNTLFGPGDSGSFDINGYAIDKLQGIGLETMVDVLTENEKSYLKKLWPDKFDFKNTLPDTPNTFWLDLALEIVDAKWGKTVTEADKRRAFVIAHLGYQIVTGRADEITEHTARLYGYVSPEAMLPLNKFAEVEYGIVAYQTGNDQERIAIKDITGRASAFDLVFNGLKYDTEYTYFTYYYDKTNAAYRQGELKTFKTKGEEEDDDSDDKDDDGNNDDNGDDDGENNGDNDNNGENISQDDNELRELLIKFYHDTGGDNWRCNDNWCSDKPLNMWFGIDVRSGEFVLDLTQNNLTGSGSLAGCTLFVGIALGRNHLTSLDLSGCTKLRSLFCTENYQLTSLDLSGCTSLDCVHCFYAQLTSLDVSGCTSLNSLCCGNNQLTSLDVSDCTSLETLDCSYNQLTSLDATHCTALSCLHCYNNKITQVITDFYDNLTYFYYDHRYTDYWREYIEDSKGNVIKVIVHYTDNGVGWWYPGEPQKGYHGK